MKTLPSAQRLGIAHRRNDMRHPAQMHRRSRRGSSGALPAWAIILAIVLSMNTVTRGDSLSQINLLPQQDSRAADSSSLQQDTSPSDSLAAQPDSPAADSSTTAARHGGQIPSAGKSSPDLDTTGMSNIIVTMKGIRARGWGEYKVGGRCLCCDNLLDGDCIVVQNTNRTDQVRLKQVVDGKTEADPDDPKTYFGDLTERDRAEFVSLMMVEVTLKKMQDISAVIVYTMVDSTRKKNYLSNCELGYYDQFDRLQWIGRVENKGQNGHIIFTADKPFLTNTILLKIRGGKNRVTEIAVFCKNSNE